MSLIPPKKESNFEITPAGNHVARVYQIIHLGTIPETYMGEEKMTSKIRVYFELPNEVREFKPGEGEKPFSISQEYTFSMNGKAKLRALVEGMVGAMNDDEADYFDLETLVGKTCLVNVAHKTSAKGNEYSVIMGTSPLPKGTTAPEPFNDPKVYSVETITQEQMMDLPDFLKDKIRSSLEYQRHTAPSREEVEAEPAF